MTSWNNYDCEQKREASIPSLPLKMTYDNALFCEFEAFTQESRAATQFLFDTE